jgi:hypothetical protein
MISTGLFRDDEDWARVRHVNGREIDMPRDRYKALKLKPPFEDLPLAASADAREAHSPAV